MIAQSLLRNTEALGVHEPKASGKPESVRIEVVPKG
jgi:hypothetical protein